MAQQRPNNVIRIGDSVQPKLTLFGDDSAFGTTSAFAFATFQQPHLEPASAALSALKQRHGIPQNVPQHMRILFSGHARSKVGLSISREGVEALLRDLVHEMNQLPFFIQGSCHTGALPASITPDSDPNLATTWSIKAMQSLLAKDALVRLNFEHYKYDDMRIIVAEDSTRVHFLGKNRRQAHGWAGGFSDIGAPEGFVYHFNPLIRTPLAEPLLQIADAMVYAIAHAFDPTNENPIFAEILSAVRNMQVAPIAFKTDPPA